MLASGEVHEPLDRARASRTPAARSPRRASRRSRSASSIPTPIPSTSARRARSSRKALPDAYVSLSHEILREYREFERTSTTVVNAYIGPKVGGYVQSLQVAASARSASAASSSIMQSNGGVMTPEVATQAARWR